MREHNKKAVEFCFTKGEETFVTSSLFVKCIVSSDFLNSILIVEISFLVKYGLVMIILVLVFFLIDSDFIS